MREGHSFLFDEHETRNSRNNRRRIIPPKKTILVIVIIVAAVIGGICYIDNTKDKQQNPHAQNITEPTFTPTKKGPTKTPAPTPTLTPVPAPTPTPLPGYIIATVATTYASCNGRYQGLAMQARIDEALDDIHDNLLSAEDLYLLTRQQCQDTPGNHTQPPSTHQNTDLVHFTRLKGADRLYEDYPDTANAFMLIPWVHDLLDSTEQSIARAFIAIAYHNPKVAAQLPAMPFLNGPDHGDLHALQTIAQIAKRQPQILERLLDHPLLQAGIYDEDTPKIATLSSLHQLSFASAVAHITYATATTHRFTSPIGGDTTITIITVPPQQPVPPGPVINAAIALEHFMGAPLPTRHIIIHLGPGVTPGMAATHHGSHITINPLHLAGYTPLITHELAHYYWNGNPQWLDEGMAAEFTNWHLANQNSPTVPPYPSCPTARSINQLQSQPKQHNLTCHHTLGQALLAELRAYIGDQTFAAAASSLWLDPQNQLHRLPLGPLQMETHLGTDPEAHRIIRHHLSGAPIIPANRTFDISDPNPALISIDATISQAHIVPTPGESEHTVRLSRHQGPLQMVISTSPVGPDPKGAPQEPTTLQIYLFHQDGTQAGNHQVAIPRPSSSITTDLVPPLPHGWRTGQYWAMVYDQDHKVAQIQWFTAP